MPPQMIDNDARSPLLVKQETEFDITAEQLVQVIEKTSLLSRLGGTGSICQLLKVDTSTGLLPDESFDVSYGVVQQAEKYAIFADRKRWFGKNCVPEAPAKSLAELVWVVYNDQTLIMLTVAAVISLVVGIWEDGSSNRPVDEPKVGWVDGVAILVAVAVVVVTNAINDYEKEKQFQKLNAKKEDRPVKVLRGGLSQQIHIQEIVVGDIMFIEPGDVLNVDCLYIEGHNLRCDESAATGESKSVKKDIDSKGDCIIISGSKITQGVAKVVVIAVGVNSHYGRATTLMRNSKEEITPLQLKLNVLADQIAKFGFIAAGLMLLALLIKMSVICYINQEWIPRNELSTQLLSIVIQAITIIVVAVPEGLPMAVTLALAFATTEMLKDNNLVRHLSACETMGNATAVCSDKTGTLTENKMTVVCASIAETKVSFNNNVKANCNQINPTGMSLAIENMCVNSTAFEGKDADGQIKFIGPTTECALLEWVNKLGYSYQELRTSSCYVNVYPFNSTAKSMTTVIQVNETNVPTDISKEYRLYTKGAPEMILQSCTRYLDRNGSIKPMSDYIRVSQGLMISSFASRSLRTLALAYRDIDSDTFLDFHPEDPPLDNLVLIGIIGIQDQVREGVIESIQEFRRAGVVVRMITGDNLETAKAIAKECGILTSGGVAMTGPEFRALSPGEQYNTVPRLQVLARSSPIDKTLVVSLLQERNEVVAMTGDGTNDGPALKLANVGFAMGITGTEVAKEASDIILMDDNFNSILQALKWGRAVSDGVKKFLTFQLTVNIVAVVISFISAILSDTSESILGAVQLLWVNMIMDTFAALALATEPLTDELVNRKPLRKDASLINWRMSRMIFGQALFQITINLLLMYHGASVFGLSSGGSEEDRQVLRTLVFNVFVFLQVFNELNCRRIDHRLNILRDIQHDRLFLIIQAFVIAGQVLIVQYGGLAFKTVPLTLNQWIVTVCIGSLSIPTGALIRLLPNHIPGIWSENRDDEFNHEVTYSRLRWESVVSRIMKDINHKKNEDLNYLRDPNKIQPVIDNFRKSKGSDKRHLKA